MLVFIHSVISSLAWPVVVAGALYVFKGEIRNLLGRLQSVSKTGAEFGPIAPQKKVDRIDTIPTTAHVAPAYRPLIEEMVPEILSVINKQLEDDGPQVRNTLALHITDLAASVLLERAYNLIFGSQISAIEYIISSSGSASRKEVKQFYDHASRNYPAVYASYSFEQWLDFLRNSNLVEVADDTVTVRPLGRALVPYMLLRSYPRTKPA